MVEPLFIVTAPPDTETSVPSPERGPQGDSPNSYTASSVSLRENNPDFKKETPSSTSSDRNHARSPSATSFNSTIPDKSETPLIPLPKRRFFGLLPAKPVIVARIDPTPAEMAPFPVALNPSALYSLIDPKSVSKLHDLGGIEAILKGLGSNAETGLSTTGEGIAMGERQRVYGLNRVPERKGKSLLRLMWMAYQDKVLLILSVAAVVSLALGLYQDLGTPPTTYASTSCANNLCTEPQLDWVEGVAITLAILIVVLVGAVNDYQKEAQFRILNAKKEERNVKVIRDGAEKLLSVYDVVVGDILILEPGEIIPVDGIFLSGYNVRCDESGASGESDAVKKLSYDELRVGGGGVAKADCFLISGSKVLEGVGTYVVTAVGESSFFGKIMMSLRGDTEETPLQLKLNALAELIAKLGSLAGIILFTALMIRFFVSLATDPGRTSQVKAQNFIQILIIAVTIVVVAVPEGLPLAVTLALAFATKRMTKQGLLVRVLGACETMANATVICTDKTGTLTTNKMTVVAGSIGIHLKFANRLSEHADRTNANIDVDSEKEMDQEKKVMEKEKVVERKGRLDFSTDTTEINSHVSLSLRNLLNDSISINSTAFEEIENGESSFVGSKTETALLAFAKAQEWQDYKATRSAADIVQMIPFSSERKSMGVVLKLSNGNYRVLFKGASEVLAKLSNRHVVVNENNTGASSSAVEVESEEFNEETRTNITRTIIFYANQSLRTIALCSRDFKPTEMRRNEAGEFEFNDLAKDLTLVAIAAIEDPLRDGVTEAVTTCSEAGVAVKMCTGDNVLTARAIATQCGIYKAGGIIMEGPVFRNLSVAERFEILPRLQVLARSSPEDKKILVEQLKLMGEVVAVTGDGSNDGPALKTANVGFSMGITGTEVAKEASDIILMDDNFSSIVSAIMWGRCVNDSVKKFLQFQISVNITAVIITFVSAVASSDGASVLTAVQLLWVNLIMDTFAALALATDPATPESLNRKPDRKTAPLINVQMWMMIIGQAVYQTIVALVLHFAGAQILGLQTTDLATSIDQSNELNTLVFNTFVWCQIFNQLNARRLDRGFNIFTGLTKNYYFIAIFIIMVAGQVLIVQVGGPAFQVVPIGGRDWAISIILGLLSLPLAILIRLLPPGPFETLLIRLRLYPDPTAPLPVISPQAAEKQWNEGINKVVDNLTVFAQIRGGRMRSSSMLMKSRSKQMKIHDIHPTSLMAMVPSLVIGAIGAGWTENGTLSDPASSDPSRSSAALWNGKIISHPETDRLDPLALRYDSTRARPAGESAGHTRGNSLKIDISGNSLSPPSPLRQS